MNQTLLNQLNESGYVFYFLVVDKFLDIQLYPQLKNFHLIYAYHSDSVEELKKVNAPYFCLEETGDQIAEKNTGRLLSHPKVLGYINQTSHGQKIAIIPFKPSAKIDLICKKNNWINISNESSLNRLLEDKIKFQKICTTNNLPVIKSEINTFTQSNFEKYQKEFSSKLVIQTHFGWAGNSTHFGNSWDELKNKITEGVIVKYSPYLSGYSLLNNCCLTKFGLLQSPPALQYTGLKEFTENPFATVGRQWPSQANDVVNNQVIKITENFSNYLQSINYKGFFGLDFLVHNNQVYLLECNPRLTASFAFYTQIEMKNDITPLFYFHLAEFLGINYEIDFEMEQKRTCNKNIVGSEITKKDQNSNTIQKINAYQIFSSSCDPIAIDPKIIKQFL